MDPPPTASRAGALNNVEGNGKAGTPRTKSFSEASDDSQTAAEFINSQLKLEADAREALPYKFDACTKPLGPLRQLLFACLTCNPPESNKTAAVCYSCSVSCHGEHTLVELFNKRNFVCDCGTTRLPSTSPCQLRLNPVTNLKGGVVLESAEPRNKYNHNFRNRFCGCECDYDPQQQKGTMFQCLGLGAAKDGGCGEDWYHPGCVVGLGPTWYEDQPTSKTSTSGPLEVIMEDASTMVDHERGTNDNGEDGPDDDDVPPPPGFPNEDNFDGFICYKCVDANPWIKRYAGTDGFLEPVFRRSSAPSPERRPETNHKVPKGAAELFSTPTTSRKRKSEDGGSADTAPLKRVKDDDLDLESRSIPTETSENLDVPINETIETSANATDADAAKPNADSLDYNTKSANTDTTGTLSKIGSHAVATKPCKYEALPPAPEGTISLFLKSGFRDHLCHCSSCFPRLAPHPQLLEEEEAYEPPVSSDGGSDANGSTHGSGGSLLDRGERALTNVDRVRAIEGVMAYNHLKEKLKPFFKEFAESGKAISAEDIKAHFAKIRGDEEAIRQAAAGAAGASDGDGDHRREQSGY